MSKYRVEIPVFLKIEEIHIIEADSEDEAKELALEADPGEIVEDVDYYEVNESMIRVTLSTDDDVFWSYRFQAG